MSTNRYLTKISSLLGAAAAAGALHIGQNVAMRQAFKSKALKSYVADGFRQGIHGVVDTSLKAKTTKLLLGGTLPEVALMKNKAHDIGATLAPHLSKMSLKEKAILHAAASGNIASAVKRGLADKPELAHAYNSVKGHLGLPDLERLKNGPKIKSDLLDVVKSIHKGKMPVGTQFKPGRESGKLAAVGAGLSGITTGDAAVGGLNTIKAMMGAHRLVEHPMGHRVVNWIENRLVKNPFKKATESATPMGPIRTKLEDVLISPTRTEAKIVGAQWGQLKNKVLSKSPGNPQ